MLGKMDEMKVSIELESIESQIKQLNEANGQNLARMRGLQDAGKLNPPLAANIDSEFQRNSAEIQRLLGEQTSRLEKRIEILKELQLQSLKEAVALAGASVDAVIAIREDLGIATDADELERHFKDSISFVDETFPGLVNDVWRKALREISSE
jgi:DNA-binding transcriptional MerR regulator